MALSHGAPTSATSPALANLHDFLAARERAPLNGNFADFEAELRTHIMAVEREATARELARYDLDIPDIIVDGVTYKRAYRGPASYQSASGTISVERSLFRAAPDERCICPMELRAGLIEDRWTPMAAEQAVFTVAHLPPRHAHDLFVRMGTMAPSAAALDRLPKAISALWEQQRVGWEAAIRDAEDIPAEATQIAVSLDGVMAPMVAGNAVEKRQAAQKQGKRPSGPNGYREVGCGTVSLLDAEGNRLRTVRLGRMPQKNKAAVKDWLVAEVTAILAASPRLLVTKLADGAPDNWTFLSAHWTDGVELLDFYHAAEHLSVALAAAYGEGSALYRRQFAKLRAKLRDEADGVGRVIRSLRYLRSKYPRRKTIGKELSYFLKNRERMRYAEQRARHGPIGSGVVEAACKTLVTTRMKGAGMRWKTTGGQAILTLRGLIQSGRFDQAWERIRHAYVVDVQPPHGVISFPRIAS